MTDKLSAELLRETSFDDSLSTPDNNGLHTPPAYEERGACASPGPSVVHVVEPIHIHQVPADPDPIPRKSKAYWTRQCIMAVLIVFLILIVILAVIFMAFCLTGEHCFKQRPVEVSKTESLNSMLKQLNNSREPPGQLYGPNDQCIMLFGKESYYCGGATEDKKICEELQCFHPNLRYCFTNQELKALDGTSCGNKKWCQKGECVSDPQAPENDDFCLFGDYMGPYRNGLSCVVIRTQQPWHCYNEYYMDDCCRTCQDIKNKDNPECPFGDHNYTCLSIDLEKCSIPYYEKTCCRRCKEGGPKIECPLGDRQAWCGSYISEPWHCYTNDDTCCETCLAHRTNVTGCLYGDKANWCKKMPASQCYNDEELCCFTCNRLRKQDKDEGCRYGDKAQWCSTVTAEGCYNNSTAEACCEGCLKFYTGIPGCEYGNKGTWCTRSDFRPYECYSQANLKMCCETCAGFRSGPPGCEYGDIQADCTKADCEDRTRSKMCCETCQDYDMPSVSVTSLVKWSTPVGGCYDQKSWCSQMTPAMCQFHVRDLCCQSCIKLATGPAGCEFGDLYPGCRREYCDDNSMKKACCKTCAEDCENHVAWCGQITPRECYSSSGACCKTCAKYETNIKDCKYGDRYSWCEKHITSLDDCQPDRYLNDCCYTCLSFHMEPSSTQKLTKTTSRLTPTTSKPSTKSTTTKPTPSTPSTTITTTTTTTTSTTTTKPSTTTSTTQSTTSTSKPTTKGTTTTSTPSPTTPTPTTTSTVKTHVPSTSTRSTSTQKVTTIVSPRTTLTSNMTILPWPGCPTQSVPSPTWCSTITPSNCYTSSDTCCEQCAQHWVGIQGCEYGDRVSWCDSHIQSGRQCYNTGIHCCDKCKHYYTGVLGCEYGDKEDGCSVSLCTTPEYITRCCNTCKHLYTPVLTFTTSTSTITSTRTSTTSTTTTTTTPPQPFECRGDQASWCKTSLNPTHCYTESVGAETCCEACQKLKVSNITGCEYGDKFSWCSVQYCSSYPEDCCLSCNTNFTTLTP